MLDMTFAKTLFYFVINYARPSPKGQVDLNFTAPGHRNPTTSTIDTDDKPDQYRITAYSRTGTIDLLLFTMKEFPADALSNDNMMGI